MIDDLALDSYSGHGLVSHVLGWTGDVLDDSARSHSLTYHNLSDQRHHNHKIVNSFGTDV